MSGHDVSTLPKWAQDEIQRLRTEVARLKAECNAGPNDTDTYVNHLGDLIEGPKVEFQPLRRGALITWWPGDGWPRGAFGRIQALYDDERHAVEVRGSGMGACLMVEPVVSNVVRIREVRY